MSTLPHDPDGEHPECECGAREGEYHRAQCRWEICPFCGTTQAEGCDCIYDHLGLRCRGHDPDSSYLPENVYSGGVSEQQQKEWDERCADRGRLRFVYSPQFCGRCGALWPDFFSVQDSAWEYYVGPTHRNSVLCQPCFLTIKTRIDEQQTPPDWVPTGDEISAYMRAWQEGDRGKMEELDLGKFEPYSRRDYSFPPNASAK